MAIDAGTRVGKYVVKRLLGKGGFGMVFLARDEMLGRDCALKFLLSEHTARPQVLNRFLNEARAAAGIDHAGIVTVFECGVVEGAGAGIDGTAYIAMELLRGSSLAACLLEGPLAIDRAVAVARQVAAAVGAAHAAGIIHRDLKPDNIFLVPDAEAATGERVKVLDFGIAKLMDDTGGSASGAKTSTHMVFGTPRYMSPEQCRSTAAVDERSDVYALGCILYEMVCGAPPFEGDAGLLIAMHQLSPVPRASVVRKDLPAQLDDAIAKMLAKEPADRPQTMAQVRALLGGRDSRDVRAASEPAPRAAPPAVTVAPGAPTSGTGDRAAPAPAVAATVAPGAPTFATGVAPAPAVAVASGAATAAPGDRVAPVFAPVPPTTPLEREGTAPAGRSRWPLVVGGLAAVGGVAAVIAIAVPGPKPGPAVADAARTTANDDAAPVDAAPPVPVRTREETIRADMQLAAEALEDGDCRQYELAKKRVEDGLAALDPAARKAIDGWTYLSLSFCRAKQWLDPQKVYKMLATGSAVFGPKDALVTIVVAGDHACPHCRTHKRALADVRARHKDDVRIVVRPRIVHPDAAVGWYAVCAAARQGGEEAFERVDAALYQRFVRDPKVLARPAPKDPVRCYATPEGCPGIEAIAAEAEVDVARFKDALATCAVELEAAHADWDRLGIRAIPTTLINGHPLHGAATAEELLALVEAELRVARERIAAGADKEKYYWDWVLGRGASTGDPKPGPRVRDAVSERILARAPHGQAAFAKLASVAFRSTGVPRTESAALAIASRAYTDATVGGLDFVALAKKHDLDRSMGLVPLDNLPDEPRRLVARMQVGEVGLIGAGEDPGKWYVVARVATPGPEPLESADILARPEAVKRAVVAHILLSVDRDRPRTEVEETVAIVRKRLATGEPISSLLPLSDDKSPTGTLEVKPGMMVEPFERLSFRLAVGEVGVVRTRFGIHIVKRVE